MGDESVFDELKEECGVFGIIGHPDAARLTYYGLHALQHRGQESAGMVATGGTGFRYHRSMGLVHEVFNGEILKGLVGDTAIGHVRYSTSGESLLTNAQPLVFHHGAVGQLALATNGNLINADRLKKELESRGAVFHTTSDTEVIAHLIVQSGASCLEEAVIEALNQLVGAYALLILTNDQLLVAQDPHGLRPLSMGMLGDSYVFSSETCAFDVIGAEPLRTVEPGELLILDLKGKEELRSLPFAEPAPRAVCSFEYIYFARPDSDIDGINVHAARKRLGGELYREAPVEADVVTGVPDSSTSAAIGFAEAAGIPYELGLIKNRYVARTFIQPSQHLREQGVKMKLSAVRKVVEGKRVVIIDDSLVRGTTSRRIVRMLKEAGAREVHVRISSPPVRHSCFYGIDTSDRTQLIAAQHSVEEIREIIGADSLSFLSEEGLIRAVGRTPEQGNCGHCLACFNGKYPTAIEEELPQVAEGKSR
ncbi:amidophosphoribosyltransferase [Kroppenstedtia eburnea]|uniref:Amidophosphoribosyltransferase n=1 Tax=Kroppenstedtia eburnea TaxID=714067 RepID=A0A1N7NHL6_9BACL|nr:amidophosphoribosyltransferase [Kroppenstedtia eburnea]QKI80946.1 amidophosphoribosyltransferase [Kroppenstedtia eburnea]SIS97913.1 amidophosphoribosyltransferase [Kroppenstedtia eburnea]